MQSIQRLYRFIFLFLYFAILFVALFRCNKETKDKIDLTFESIACKCANRFEVTIFTIATFVTTIATNFRYCCSISKRLLESTTKFSVDVAEKRHEIP